MEIVGIFLVVLLIGAVVLQILFSKGKSRMVPFLLPALNFLASLLMQLNIYVNRAEHVPNPPNYELFMFLGQNVITAVLLIVHFIVSRWKKRQNELRRMHIQDLK